MKNSPERIVEPELLDELPPQDHRALQSRLDLRRLNQWMNHPRIMAGVLRENLNVKSPRIVELGAGDGHFLLSVARRLQKEWPNAGVTLVDRLDAFAPKIDDEFQALGWRVQKEIAGVIDWLEKSPPDAADAIINNLFLHQFPAADLAQILRLAARSTNLFIALEPRRAWLPWAVGHLLWCIGCNSVTRHDAGISIRAGFSGPEISALWEDKKNWELTEQPFGLFSHLFIARRKE